MGRNGQPWGKVEVSIARLHLLKCELQPQTTHQSFRCDLQVAIHEGLVKVQDDILEAIVNFIDNFHITVMMLSASQMHALLDHMHARCAGSHSFLAAV